jgi:hypothetical protein
MFLHGFSPFFSQIGKNNFELRGNPSFENIILQWYQYFKTIQTVQINPILHPNESGLF